MRMTLPARAGVPLALVLLVAMASPRAHEDAPMSAPATAAAGIDVDALMREVADTERAFARTMASRDFEAFQRFIADDAVFIDKPAPLRGRRQVAAGWKPLFAKPEAPFSWEPEEVQVVGSGGLALTHGAVRDPAGKPIGTFTSVWRRDPDGAWRIVLDRGDRACN